MKPIFSLLRIFVSLRMTVVSLLGLAVLIFWGTLVQKDVGIWGAQERFFQTWVVMAGGDGASGGFPVMPGARTWFALLIVNLTASMVVLALKKRLGPGIALVHGGLLIMLLSGAWTQWTAEESFIDLIEGESTNVAIAYHDWDMVLWKVADGDPEMHAIDIQGVVSNETFVFEPLGIQVEVESYYRNSIAAALVTNSVDRLPVQSPLGAGTLFRNTPEMEPSKNKPGILFTLSAEDAPLARVILHADDAHAFRFSHEGEEWSLALRRKRFPLPFDLKLINFEEVKYENSQTAKEYSSVVEVSASGRTRQVKIEMNKPLRFEGYTLYQSRFARLQNGMESSNLAVMRDSAEQIPYWATGITVSGMVIHFGWILIGFNKRRKQARDPATKTKGATWKPLVASLVGLLILLAYFGKKAGEGPGEVGEMAAPKAFATMPVQLSGRLMPMDSVARNTLQQLSGKRTFNRRPAIEWMARVFFDPTAARDDRVFLINNVEVLETLQMESRGRDRYTFAEIEDHLPTLAQMASTSFSVPDDKKDAVDREFLNLHHNINTWLDLTTTFVFALQRPELTWKDPDFKTTFGFPSEREVFSFHELYTKAPQFGPHMGRIEQLNPLAIAPGESQFLQLITTMMHWARHYADAPLPMLVVDDHGPKTWVSPWQAYNYVGAQQTLYQQITWLQEATSAAVSGDQAGFDSSIEKVIAEVESKLEPGEARRIRWELAYNRMPLFGLSTVFYGLAAIGCMIALLSGRRGGTICAFVLLLLAFVPHSAGIVMRMVIMDRPPVTNLYATFLFVPWVMVCVALVLEYFYRNRLGILAAALSGLALLLLSRRFETEADSLGVVVAVLNSNFWLLTHVICITAGYAAVALAGILGHFYLVRAIGLGPKVRIQPELYSALFGILALGLILSFFGTMLGGVWGGQSWGRFWGWDPKENGALLIVLWMAILLHGIPARLLSPNWVAAGAVLGNIVVLWAWMGTNLLGVGLHSYGFLAGRFYMMIGLMAFEFLFVVVTLTILTVQKRRINALV